MEKMKIIQGVFWGSTALLVGVLSWHLGARMALQELFRTTGNLREVESGYRYIRPLLACDILRDFESTAYAPLKEELESYIQLEKQKGDVQEIGVYYRDLRKGQWTAVNGDVQFHPASLFKVPNMISILREEDLGRDILAKTYTVDPTQVPARDQAIPPERALEDHETYTVDDLLRYMIVYSDNRANHALDQIGDPAILEEVFEDFTIDLQKDANGVYTISPRDYALLFRGLYNATYLSRTLSEKGLAYLGQTDFKDGLRASLPTDTKIAHKFGNFVGADENGEPIQELHDCGIIYGPRGDYALCVMTRGQDVEKLKSAIAEISRIVYSQD